MREDIGEYMLKRIMQNARKPKGKFGQLMVKIMNFGHTNLSKWGFSHIEIKENCDALDIGCGGGKNLAVLLSMCKRGTVTGFDYSEASVVQSIKTNQKEVNAGRCKVIQGNVSELPFSENSFDIITAFETVYFWPDIEKAFSRIYLALKLKGRFMICNEMCGENKSDDRWTKIIDGMTIYNEEQLKTNLMKSGFSKVDVYKDKKGHLCVVAYK